VGRDWPFREKRHLNLESVIGHCSAITAELDRLHGIERRVHLVSSQIIVDTEIDPVQAFAEIGFPTTEIGGVSAALHAWPHEVYALHSSDSQRRLSATDCERWHDTFDWSRFKLKGYSMLRTAKEHRRSPSEVMKDTTRALQGYALLPPRASPYPSWEFSLPIEVGGQTIPWHPVLSDYLVSFALSELLRYQPHRLEPGGENCFLAQAWCSQSPSDVIGYFVGLLTDPPIILGQA
jgi:hypothetical protein